MGDVLVKGIGDKDEEAMRALETRDKKQDKVIARERPKEGEVGVGKVTRDSTKAAFEDLGITRTTPTKIREDDDDDDKPFISTTGLEERDRKRLEEELENAKEAGD